MNTEQGTDRGYSPDVAGILGRKPHWIVRRGMILVALVFGVGLIGTWFLHYPERFNCTISFGDNRICPDNQTDLHGVIRLQTQYGSGITPGMPVRILLASPEGKNPLTATGRVDSVVRDSAGIYTSVLAHFSSDRGTVQKFLMAGQANAQIITGNSNMLQQIFNPVISVIRGAGQNKQKGNQQND
jgi:hypothetical protein